MELVKRVAATFDTKVFGGACFGADWAHYGIASKGFLSAQDFVTAANSAKVCVDFARNRAGDLMVKHRMFEFAACGAVTCTEHFPDLAEHFIYGKEILGYDTDDELICQIRKCLEDPAYRDGFGEVIERGRRAVRIDVRDVLGSNASVRQRELHAPHRTVPSRVGGCDVMRVSG